jgi:SCY1-like protein 1
MGNSASSLPYSIGEKKPNDDGCWAVHDGSHKSDGVPVTVFQAQKPQLAKEGFRGNPSEKQIFVAHHHFVMAKKLRHPFILQVLATLDTDAPSNEETSTAKTPLPSTGAYIIVTERCKPLQDWLIEDAPNADQLAWGLQCIVQGISFLHTGAQMAHGNICPKSFWVTPSGDVKLWNFGLVTPIGVVDGGGGPSQHFRQYEGYVTPQAYRSPERTKEQWEALATNPVHCMDSFSLGVLINDYYHGDIPGPLQKASQRLITPTIKMRPRLAPLLKCPIFETPYAKLMQNLMELQVQPVDQKLRFWQSLNMEAIDPSVSKFKILPIVQSTITSICSSDVMSSQELYRREVLTMLPPLFYISENLLDKDEITKALSPLVQLLFSVKDRGVRGALLGKTPLFAAHLSKPDLNTLVFEPLCSGFADSSDALRELTLKATFVLVPHLYPPNVEKLSRYLVRLQSDTSPSIRTHTMLMIPQLAPHLSEVARQKLLLPAFARSSKDPHPPCRLASLKSTTQCQEYFSLEELATKVLPSCMPLVLDGVGDVRSAAFNVIDEFLDKLKKSHKERSIGEVSETVPTISNQMPVVSSASAPVVTAPTSGGYLGSLSGWYGGSSTTTSAPAPTAKPSASPSAPTPPQISAPPKPAAPSFSSLNIGGEAMGATTGWDDDDDDLDLGDTKEEDVFASIGLNKRASNTASATKKLIMHKTLPSTKVKKAEVKKLSIDDELDGWDDF